MRQGTAAPDERSTGPATGLTVGLDLADASSSVCVEGGSAMSVWVQAKSVAGRAGAAAKRRARRGRLELQVRDLRSDISRVE